MGKLAMLKPERVFEYFERICSVPHGSGNTKQISDLCVAMAKELGLECYQDEVNNVVIRKDASAGYENAQPIILQGHIDMVCAKTDDCTKDMTKEGLDLATDGVDVWAEKTSLGGDDGIAVAMIFAILSDESLAHPPLECVLTVDEEVGMDGAFALDCSGLKGRKLLNLDSEEEGVFTVGCAGGVRSDSLIPAKRTSLCGETAYKLTVSGLLGGHSGVDIDKGRASANVIMARVIHAAKKRFEGLRLCAFNGGDADNAICSRCEAVVALNSDEKAFSEFVFEYEKALKNEYAGCDAGISLSLEKTDADSAVSKDETAVMMNTLIALPQGVQEMSMDFPGLVQTSLNLGIVALCDDGLRFTHCIRSSIATQKEFLLDRVISAVTLAGGSVSTKNAYPGWQYVKESDFRDLILSVWKERQGKEGELLATHGGLECGLFIEKIPGLDAVSLGPDLRDIHSVNERLGVASTARVYDLVCEVLKRSR